MTIRSLLLAGAVFPFAFGQPVLGIDLARGDAPRLILAQAETECPEGTECVPSEEAPAAEEAQPEQGQNNRRQRRDQRRQDRQQQQQQGEQAPAEEPAAEEPAAEQPAAEQPAAEEPAAEEPPAEQPPAEQPPAEEPAAEETPAEQPAAEEPAAEQPAAEEPAAEEPAAEEAQPAEGGQSDRRQQRRRERQRQEQQTEQPAAEQQAPAAEQPAAEEAAPAGETTVEQQLEAQGDEQQAEQVRRLRRQLREERRRAESSEEVADEEDQPQDQADGAGEEAAADGDRQRRRDGGEVVERRGDRVIIREGDRIFVEPADRDDIERLLFGANDVKVERLRNGRTRTIVFRDNGSQIVTVRDRNGDIIRRTRITRDGREVVLIDNRERDVERPPLVIIRPPRIVDIPEDRYIVDLGRASRRELQEVLLAPPVQPLERQYTLEEVVRSEPLRSYVPRIDLDTITFEFGSATIGDDQVPAIIDLGEAMEAVLAEHPDEVYLVEGHTDAVGSEIDNLVLSDRRAEAVAVALSQNFDIPPENLVTEGYGEEYLKVPTQEPERANRRVTVRRITPLLESASQ
jgi:outer membrane protein OmpA-like peptidoglycan-associated protein